MYPILSYFTDRKGSIEMIVWKHCAKYYAKIKGTIIWKEKCYFLVCQKRKDRHSHVWEAMGIVGIFKTQIRTYLLAYDLTHGLTTWQNIWNQNVLKNPGHVVAMAMRSHREAVGNDKRGSNWQAWKTLLPVMCRTVWNPSTWKAEKAKKATLLTWVWAVCSNPESSSFWENFPTHSGKSKVHTNVGQEAMF